MGTLIIKKKYDINPENRGDIVKLFYQLGISYYTDKNMNEVSIWIDSEERNTTKLLDMLGEWENQDLVVAEKWKIDLGIAR